MLKLLHLLFPGLHEYHKGNVSLVLDGGVVMPVRQAVCRCGDHQPLGAVEVQDLHTPAGIAYDPTAGRVDTPNGPAKFVQYVPHRAAVVVEHDYEHLAEYPADLCFIRLEGVC